MNKYVYDYIYGLLYTYNRPVFLSVHISYSRQKIRMIGLIMLKIKRTHIYESIGKYRKV